MINHFCKKPLWEVSRTLADVAMGRRPADLVLDATLVNVCTGELLPHTDVAVAEGRIAMVGACRHCIGEGTTVVDAAGLWLPHLYLCGPNRRIENVTLKRLKRNIGFEAVSREWLLSQYELSLKPQELGQNAPCILAFEIKRSIMDTAPLTFCRRRNSNVNRISKSL